MVDLAQQGYAQAEEDHVMAAFAIALNKPVLTPEQNAYIKAHRGMALALFKARQTQDPHALALEISQLLEVEHDLAAHLGHSHRDEPGMAN